MPRPDTSIGLDQDTAEQVRQVARELAARERRKVTLPEAIRAAIAAWRQLPDPAQQRR